MTDTIVTWQRPDHPHNSAEFAAHTGLTHYYPKYMVGGGYVVSADVAAMIVVTHQLARDEDRLCLTLIWTPLPALTPGSRCPLI